MKTISILIASSLFLTGCLGISGVVKDSLTGSPIPSAVVNIGSRSVTTNAIGYYYLDLVSPGETLLISAHGYHTQVHSVPRIKRKAIDIKLIQKK